MVLNFRPLSQTIFNNIELDFFSIQGLIFFNIGSSGKRPERPAEPEEPPKPRKKEEKEEKEERSEGTAKGEGKKGKDKNPNWRPRSEEGTKYQGHIGAHSPISQNLIRQLETRGRLPQDGCKGRKGKEKKAQNLPVNQSA